MRLTRADIDKIDLERLRPFVANQEEFFGRREHYRLLAYLSLHAKSGRIIDVGTHLGDSAVALSYAGAQVDSFDLVDKREGRPAPSNVSFFKADLFNDAMRDTFRKRLLESSLILIDVDPHEGTRELGLVRWLEANDYQGTIVLDDIWYFKQMRDNLWYKIPPRFRTDVTDLGHWSGTGIVSYVEPIELENRRQTDNWTLVTGYFDLTKKDDATDEIRARPAEHYLDQHGSSVLSLDKNLVIFCDPHLEEKVWSMRPPWLHSRTRVYTTDFESLPLTQYRSRIIENRGGHSACSADPRNNASYYLFCMARYAMLKKAIAMSDFNFKSTHFAWINICIERMGYNNLVHLDEALGQQRDKFSTCWIDYVAKETVEDLPRYFGARGCATNCVASTTMCSGFFTGRDDHMRTACERFENEFKRCLDLGYGHADEQLFPIVHYKNPDSFDWYVGDYQEMITNYAGVYERPEQPIRNLIAHSLAAGDVPVANRAANIVMNAYATGKCKVGIGDYSTLVRALEAGKAL